MQQQQPQRRVLPHTIDATCEAALGCQENEGEVRVLCVCATLCVVEEKHIVNGVEHVKQQTGRPRRTTRTVCCHFLCAAGFKVRTRVQGV